MNSNPKVSVIIPFYNGSKYIEETLSSVFSQTYEFIEIIVVDDCSSFNESKYLDRLKKDYGFKLYKNSINLGTAKSILYGCEKSTGDLISIVGQDDIFFNDKLRKQVSYLVKNQSKIACYCGFRKLIQSNNEYVEFPMNDTTLRMRTNKVFPKLYYFNDMCLTLQGLLIKKEIVEKEIYSLWRVIKLDDWPVHIRLFEKFSNDIGFIKEVLFTYRVHNNSVSSKKYTIFSLACEVIATLCPDNYKKKAIEFQVLFLNDFIVKDKKKKNIFKRILR